MAALAARRRGRGRRLRRHKSVFRLQRAAASRENRRQYRQLNGDVRRRALRGWRRAGGGVVQRRRRARNCRAGPFWRVVVRATRANAFYAALQVSDTGIGIAEEDREKIFERFYRTDKARNRREGGTGLGLSIVQWIAESHGGKIEVESASGRGSTFTVYLPRRQGEKRQVPLGSLPDPRMLHPEQMH